MSKTGSVNVKMVITEEKILANIEKIHRMINPKSKKQIIKLDEDTYFKNLIDSVRSYLVEYPKKKNFPANIYQAANNLIDYATNQFEENTKQIEELIRQREKNIASAQVLREALNAVEAKDEDWKEKVKRASKEFSEDITDTLVLIAKAKAIESENYNAALKAINTKINNLESNLHISIDMERIEDKSKALSYIGIEIADALKLIPTPQVVAAPVVEKIEEVKPTETVEKAEQVQKVEVKETTVEEKVEKVEVAVAEPVINNEVEQYYNETRVEVKPSLFERIKNIKVVRAIRYIMKIRVVVELPALPEGNEH